jgi:diadenosine tetraphosphate (Ap4A) HIT family hydrolase
MEQEVDHVHFHVIPKPTASDDEGLVVGWPSKQADKEELAKLTKEIEGKL